MRYCPICSKELQDDMQFCPSCGTSVQITDEDPMPNRATYVGEPIPKKKHKGIKLFTLGDNVTRIPTLLNFFSHLKRNG